MFLQHPALENDDGAGAIELLDLPGVQVGDLADLRREGAGGRKTQARNRPNRKCIGRSSFHSRQRLFAAALSQSPPTYVIQSGS
jgi:hypothetical protein